MKITLVNLDLIDTLIQRSTSRQYVYLIYDMDSFRPFYVGRTDNLARRLEQHQDGLRHYDASDHSLYRKLVSTCTFNGIHRLVLAPICVIEIPALVYEYEARYICHITKKHALINVYPMFEVYSVYVSRKRLSLTLSVTACFF